MISLIFEGSKRAAIFSFSCLAFATLLITSSSFATMPNPTTVQWTDHTQQFLVGVDLRDQHYATALVTPRGNGTITIDWTCENGKADSRHFGRYKLTFYAEDTEVYTSTQECRIIRSFFDRGHKKEAMPTQTAELGNNLAAIKRVVISAGPI